MVGLAVGKGSGWRWKKTLAIQEGPRGTLAETSLPRLSC